MGHNLDFSTYVVSNSCNSSNIAIHQILKVLLKTVAQGGREIIAIQSKTSSVQSLDLKNT